MPVTPALFAFLHHVASFTLLAALAVEFALMRGTLTLQSARVLQRADIVFGIAAAVILIVGALRVLYFEKGVYYYIHNAAFLAKITLFLIVGLISILPTLEFLSWRKATRAGNVPTVTPEKLRRVRMFIHLELGGVVLILLCAAFMARGITALS